MAVNGSLCSFVMCLSLYHRSNVSKLPFKLVHFRGAYGTTLDTLTKHKYNTNKIELILINCLNQVALTENSIHQNPHFNLQWEDRALLTLNRYAPTKVMR